jgi:hypothetical protein
MIIDSDNLYELIAYLRKLNTIHDEFMVKSDIAKLVNLVLHYTIDSDRITKAMEFLDGKE